MKKMKTFLSKINAGMPINYPAFLKTLNKIGIENNVLSSGVTTRKIKGNMYVVKITSSDLLYKLNKFSNLDENDRTSLATQNMSHNQKVSGSLIICRKGLRHPYVVTVSSDGSYTSQSATVKTCLVIENLQNFLDINKTIKYLKQESNISLSDDTVMILGNGKALNNSIHKAFLSQFDEIQLFLDVDLGGLEIAASLDNMLPNSNIDFLVLKSTEIKLKEVIKNREPGYLSKVERMGQEYGFLSKVSALILRHSNTLEQEAYIHE